MARTFFDVEGKKIHLAVEGSIGGTTLGLHIATNIIERGGRVLWASPDMPDGVRFGQLFSHLSLADSSRYHAMNLVGSLKQSVDVLLETSAALPSVQLVVLDDWCSQSGTIPADKITEVKRLSKGMAEHMCLLLISKGSIDASGTKSTLISARGEKAMRKSGFEIWRLERAKDGAFRELYDSLGMKSLHLREEGFFPRV
ncbi:MAG: hypothetical protein CMA63_02065 [Euryarchaeota archaeon]|nr:hypothetical protein [Euryarchaeota archaeon]